MKTKILIEDDRTQLILEPEGEHDKDVIKILKRLPNTYEAEFYRTQGGYSLGFNHINKDLLIVFDKNAAPDNFTKEQVEEINKGHELAYKALLTQIKEKEKEIKFLNTLYEKETFETLKPTRPSST